MKAPTNRDTGMGGGKGDKPRHKLNDTWRANYDQIQWKKTPAILGAEPAAKETEASS